MNLKPREKASELRSKYWNYFVKSEALGITVLSKECALICVDEQLELLNKLEKTYNIRVEIMYLEEVRQELKDIFN